MPQEVASDLIEVVDIKNRVCQQDMNVLSEPFQSSRYIIGSILDKLAKALPTKSVKPP